MASSKIYSWLRI